MSDYTIEDAKRDGYSWGYYGSNNEVSFTLLRSTPTGVERVEVNAYGNTAKVLIAAFEQAAELNEALDNLNRVLGGGE